MRRLGLVLVFALGACRHHDDRNEHDRSDKKHEESTEPSDPLVVEPAKSTAPARDPNVVELGELTLSWPATIRESTGKAPPVGTKCTLTTRARSTKPDKVAQTRLDVICGADTLYDENATYKGTSHWEYSLGEYAAVGEVGSFVYRLTASDLGPRTGTRNQITVSTKDRELIVTRENAPTFRVKLDVDNYTTPRQGKPIFEENIPPFNQVLKAKATMTSSSGPLPFQGKTCDLAISPGSNRSNCIVRVVCGGTLVFGKGTSGWEKCTLEDGAPVGLTDKDPTAVDHDPRLTLDTHAKTLVMGDDLPNGTTYTASFSLP